MVSEYLIDQILPRREVHLIAGPSGAGKSTWALQTLVEQWQVGKEVLGYKSFPVPWLYVSGDRSMESVERTLRRIGIPRSNINVFSCIDTRVFNIGSIIKKAMTAPVPPRFFFFEGFISLMLASGLKNEYKDVSWFLTGLTATCKEQDITILGSCHAPKMKSDSWYMNPRERILGSAGWGGFCETIIVIEPVTSTGNVADALPLRRLYVLPRNAAERSIDLVFDTNGRLVESEAELYTALFTAFLGKFAAGATFKAEAAYETLTDAGLSRATVTRYLDKAVADGRLSKVAHGTYAVNRVA
jgi:hypothetical protein